jgi:hypothetical protein
VRMLGLDWAPEVKTIRRKIRLLADAGKAGERIAAMALRRVEAAPSRRQFFTSTGICVPIRAPAGSRKPMCRG